jgi:glycosyltransferase involved in cell wall biosynthesis
LQDLKISVLVPAFNEERVVAETVERVKAVLERCGVDHEVIVIDDGSSDATAQRAAGTGARVLRHPTNGGYGRALKTGMRAAGGEWIAILDADGSYPIEALPSLLERVPEFDMVVGARTGRHYRGSLMKWWGRVALQRMVRFVAGTVVPDVNSGLRVFRKSIALANIDRIGNGFSFTTTLTLAMLLEGHFVLYVPIEYLERVGRSKVRLGRDTLRTLQILVMAIVAYNPIKLFLLLAYAQGLATLLGVVVDASLAHGAHIGVVLTVGSAATLLLFALGLIADLLRPRGDGHDE